MFKTLFSKYLTAFVIVIFVSFFSLSGIITSLIRSFITEDNKEKLELTGSIIATLIDERDLGNVNDYIEEIALFVVPIVNFDKQFDVLITTRLGKIILSTVSEGAQKEYETKNAVIDLEGELGVIKIDDLSKEIDKDGNLRYVHRGTLGGVLSEEALVYAIPIMVNNQFRGYVITLAYTANEDKLINLTRRAVINSCILVMLAAVIASYFITKRIIQPMRNMKNASKKFAKGDFSTRVTVYGHDEVSELGQAFNNMAESLDSLEKMRNSLLANISHDLRTPMTTISGFIDGINSGAIPKEKHEYYLGLISAEVHRLSRLVSQILDVSRLESGDRKFNLTDFDIAEVARLILISFEKKIEDKKLDVEFDSENDDMYALADKDAIYQVLYNLCHNAIKFSKEGGKLRISIARISGGKLRVAVFDEGQGISQEDAKMVFDRFYKSDKSRGLDKTGVGLGLYICKTIIDAHGESIGVNSVEEENCEFWFTLKRGNSIKKHNTYMDVEIEE